MGNTPRIAQQHYLQVTEDHFRRALEAVRNPVQQPSGDPGKCWQSIVAETDLCRETISNPKHIPGLATVCSAMRCKS